MLGRGRRWSASEIADRLSTPHRRLIYASTRRAMGIYLNQQISPMKRIDPG
jgi:hypothetical protein